MIYRDPEYLNWLRDQNCYGCWRPSNTGDRNTAAHMGVSNFGIKPPDNDAIPLCGKCHMHQEYHKDKWEEVSVRPLPTPEIAEAYFRSFCKQVGWDPSDRLQRLQDHPKE